ncbi:hypothetical protein GALMADRAFT_135372 [Galerina marginata CBS 339.88]|uniref:Uncharacterized protein n=1 Tax=Galerina marginata (strain CBS 339.88) TaxID=685588 RepID=A0A067TFM7_GALM3|nr:hypothetical protein GALMADRAFT_135372 [Galerina marginata CBS 339.88]
MEIKATFDDFNTDLLQKAPLNVDWEARSFMALNPLYVERLVEASELVVQLAPISFSRYGSIYYEEDVDPSLKDRPLYADQELRDECSQTSFRNHCPAFYILSQQRRKKCGPHGSDLKDLAYVLDLPPYQDLRDIITISRHSWSDGLADAEHCFIKVISSLGDFIPIHDYLLCPVLLTEKDGAENKGELINHFLLEGISFMQMQGNLGRNGSSLGLGGFVATEHTEKAKTIAEGEFSFCTRRVSILAPGRERRARLSEKASMVMKWSHVRDVYWYKKFSGPPFSPSMHGDILRNVSLAPYELYAKAKSLNQTY